MVDVSRLLRSKNEEVEYWSFVRDRDYVGGVSLYDFCAFKGWWDRIPLVKRAEMREKWSERQKKVWEFVK